jgi:hypothetical protein
MDFFLRENVRPLIKSTPKDHSKNKESFKSEEIILLFSWNNKFGNTVNLEEIVCSAGLQQSIPIYYQP